MNKLHSQRWERWGEHKSKECIRKDKQCINYSEEFYLKKSVSTLTQKHASRSITPLKHDPGNDSVRKALHLSWCISQIKPSIQPSIFLTPDPPLHFPLFLLTNTDGHKHSQRVSEGPPDLPHPRELFTATWKVLLVESRGGGVGVTPCLAVVSRGERGKRVLWVSIPPARPPSAFVSFI